MSKISSEFILGSAIGYFFSNNFIVFTFGLATGVIIQEKFGSVYKFTEFCLDSSKQFVHQKVINLKNKFKNNPKNIISLEKDESILLNEELNEPNDKCIKNKDE